MKQKDRRLPAEWEEQDGVLMAWPHQESDWAPMLDRVEAAYIEMVRAICRFEKLILIVPSKKHVQERLKRAQVNLKQILFFELATNDTWARDFGPITIYEDGYPKVLNFVFNAWGMKFPADRDNLVNFGLFEQGVFGEHAFKTIGMVMEGGSIESDGKGTILTTAECLLSPNRNPHLSPKKIEKRLKKIFGASQLLWLSHGYLAGDDTDSHIDTLARFGQGDTMVYVGCQDKKDEHYAELRQMKLQLERFRNAAGFPYRLLELPMAKACFDEQGNRLPATYANFLVINQAVLLPTYDDPEKDTEAMEVLAEAFPGREIVGVNCLPLIEQHGSLHCVTMQIPKGVLT